MSLREALKWVGANEKIRIGTETGSGFIYEGLKKELNVFEINRQIKQSYLDKIALRMFHTPFGASGQRKKALIKKITTIVEQYLEAAPIMDREVVDSYRGQFEPETKVFIVKGTEDGKVYDPHVPSLKKETIATSAALELTAAIYKGPVDKLISDHGKLAKAAKKKNELDAEREAVEGMLEITADIIEEVDKLQEENAEKITDTEAHKNKMMNMISGLPYLSEEQNMGIIREAQIAAGRK